MQKRNITQHLEPYEIEIRSKKGSPAGWLYGASDRVRGSPANLIVLTDITERRQADEKQRESEGRYSPCWPVLFDILLIDPDTGRIVDANDAASAITGFPAKSFWNLVSMTSTPATGKSHIKPMYGQKWAEKHFSSTHYQRWRGKTRRGNLLSPIPSMDDPSSTLLSMTLRSETDWTVSCGSEHGITTSSRPNWVNLQVHAGRETCFINDAYARYSGRPDRNDGKIFQPNIFPTTREVRQFLLPSLRHTLWIISNTGLSCPREVPGTLEWPGDLWCGRICYRIPVSRQDVSDPKRVEEALHIANPS